MVTPREKVLSTLKKAGSMTLQQLTDQLRKDYAHENVVRAVERLIDTNAVKAVEANDKTELRIADFGHVVLRQARISRKIGFKL